MDSYSRFLDTKTQLGGQSGFDPLWMPNFLFPFQQSLVEWSVRKGRAAKFADCGLGKTPMQLVWSENIARKTNKPVLILTPLAVSQQTKREADKFGIEAVVSRDGSWPATKKIVITNYERLHYFNRNDFTAVVCDESSILKNEEGVTRSAVTEFMLKIPYRLLCTATASPNDFIELGTSSEALGELGYMDMLGMFFKNDQNSLHPMHAHGKFQGKWRFKAHAEQDFWRWVCSWARAIRKPSDLGFSDDGFVLPELVVEQTVVNACRPMDGFLFNMPAVGLDEQRKERRHTVQERCEEAARKVDHSDPAVCWCHLNDEGDLLERLIPGSRQVHGRHSDDEKEELFEAFVSGQLRVLITKPVIGALGLNWQHCNHTTVFPSNSYEQYYQLVRRFWRYGQKKKVKVDVITSEGESDVLENLQRKANQADRMFASLVREMNNVMNIARSKPREGRIEVPSWL